MANSSSAPAPRAAWRLLLGASVALGLLPLVGGVHFARGWWSERAGLDPSAQLATYGRAWTAPELDVLAAALDAALPPGAPLLMTPVGGDDRSGRTRYHLFLADRLHPRPVYVRQPAWASGTLVDYGSWIDYHFELLDTDGSGLAPAGRKRQRNKAARVRQELERLGVEWELEFELDLERPLAGVRLLHRGESVALDLPEARP